jgi:hypothetical protein
VGNRIFFRLMILGVAGLLGCAKYVVVNGTPYYDFELESALAGVKGRAAFETGCSAETLKVIPIGQGPWVREVGVTDCNAKRLVYVKMPGTERWVLNSDSSARSDAKGGDAPAKN